MEHVVYQVKDTIFWKQITTVDNFLIVGKVLFIKSKIQFFESKSQQVWIVYSSNFCCLSSQRYNFLKANHNTDSGDDILGMVVYQVKDTIFWKQITTDCRYPWIFDSCLSSQRYNFLKANHNMAKNRNLPETVVYQVKDTIFWKQITTVVLVSTTNTRCLSSQRYNFLKANHNDEVLTVLGRLVVYQVKDTIFWKQITTCSQFIILFVCCLSSQRYNFLKANHNV